jgi:predicted nucleotidyltransferase
MNRTTEKIVKSFSEDAREILKENLVSGYLFGSVARNDASEFSDIDILFIVQHFNYQIRKELSRLASDYSIEYGVCISPVAKDLKIWEKNKVHNTLFFQEIQRDGVRIC